MNVERAPNVHYAGTSHYSGRQKGYTTAAAIAAGTIAAGVSVPGIKFLQRFSCCSVCFTIYQDSGNIQGMLNETVSLF